MSWILLTNDDGVDSPALRPFRDALTSVGEVRTVVPEGQRSWISKALTRWEPISVTEVAEGNETLITVSGTPADAVQIAAGFFGSLPSLVVAGINIGYNHGTGYLISSGTVGAAFEGWELGIPSVAFSTGVTGSWETWYPVMRDPGSTPAWRRLSAVCVDILDDLLDVGSVADVVSVNIPWEADLDTPRRVVSPARVTYGRMHQALPDGTYSHCYREDFGEWPTNDTDIGVNHNGGIAITPLMAPASPAVPEGVRSRLEGRDRR